jgi:hypothetical protein
MTDEDKIKEATEEEMTISMVDTTSGLVEEYLSDFGDTFSKVDRGIYFAKKGSTLVGIHVVEWRNDALVHVSANVVKNADLNHELLKTMLEWNFRSSFGSFGLSPEGTINLRHTLLGSSLEKEQLIPAVLAVARNADDWDDKIVDMAGGETAVETLRKQATSPEDDEKESAEEA